MPATTFRVLSALLLLPDASAGGGADPTDPNVRKTRAGMLVMIAGIAIAQVFALLVTLFPLLIDPRFSPFSVVVYYAGATVVFMARHGWPAHRRTAAVGFILQVAGFGSTIALGLLSGDYLAASIAQGTGVGSPYHQALTIVLILDIVNVVLVTIGSLLLVWNITSGLPRRLIVAGDLLLIAFFIASHLLVLAMYDPNTGGLVLGQTGAWFFVGLAFPVGLLSNLLNAAGLLFAQWRLPATGSIAASPASSAPADFNLLGP